MTKTKSSTIGDNSNGQIKAYVERVERIETEEAALREDKKEIYAEAKGNGFDASIIRQVVRLRKMETEKRREQEELLALYWAAVGDV